MTKWKVFVNGIERSRERMYGAGGVFGEYIIEAETKEEAQQIAKIRFIKDGHGNCRLSPSRPIQYTRKVKE